MTSLYINPTWQFNSINGVEPGRIYVAGMDAAMGLAVGISLGQGDNGPITGLLMLTGANAYSTTMFLAKWDSELPFIVAADTGVLWVAIRLELEQLEGDLQPTPGKVGMLEHRAGLHLCFRARDIKARLDPGFIDLSALTLRVSNEPFVSTFEIKSFAHPVFDAP